MRHFKLVNSAGEELDITSKELFFHEPSGLGFEEENDFRQIGDFWLLNRSGRNQGTVSGTLIFNGAKPYEQYRDFAGFITKNPLILKYNPYGPIDDSAESVKNTFFRTVRVSSIEKGELTTYGTLDCSITLTCYTPWYQIVKDSFTYVPPTGNTSAWIWGNPADIVVDNEVVLEASPPLVFQPEGLLDEDEETYLIPAFVGDYTRAKFRESSPSFLRTTIEGIVTDCPAKLTIYGPIRNPSWSHRVMHDNNTTEIISTGGFSSSATVEILEGDKLVIDGMDGNYDIYRINANGTRSSLYNVRDFGKKCFINLKEGINQIFVTSNDGPAKQIDIEGHIYHATV